MDGTVYLGDGLLDGALGFLNELKKQGKRYIFLTNNSSKNRLDYVEKLRKMGVDAELDDVFTSGEASTVYLREKYPGGKCFLMGTPSLEREFEEAGFDLIREQNGVPPPDFILLGFDTTITYEKIWAACDYIRGGTPFYATHPDVNCPLPGGRLMPDAGSILKMFEASTGVSPVIIGKPHQPLISAVLSKYNLSRESLAMVGDRLATDIMLAKNAGILSVLVYSGVTSREEHEASEIKADIAVDSLGALLQYL
jgi:HAD superfamily hydrolase (TIGR01450 family)